MSTGATNRPEPHDQRPADPRVENACGRSEERTYGAHSWMPRSHRHPASPREDHTATDEPRDLDVGRWHGCHVHPDRYRQQGIPATSPKPWKSSPGHQVRRKLATDSIDTACDASQRHASQPVKPEKAALTVTTHSAHNRCFSNMLGPFERHGKNAA